VILKNDDAANQFGAAAIVVELVKPVIFFDRQARDALANFGYFQDR